MITIEEKHLLDLLEESLPVVQWAAENDHADPRLVGKVAFALKAAHRIFELEEAQ